MLKKMIFKVNITVSVNRYFNIFIVWSIAFSFMYALEILPANYTLEIRSWVVVIRPCVYSQPGMIASIIEQWQTPMTNQH